MKNLSDSSLVKKYVSGDEKALKVLIERHQQKILGFVYSKVLDRNIAEDIFQDTFMKAILTIKSGKYNEEGKFLPWIIRIAHNLTIDYFRFQKRMPTTSESFFKGDGDEEFSLFDLISDKEDGIDVQLIKEQINGDVVKLIELLPDDQRQVLEYRIFKNMSFKEVAEETNVSINTALGRMRYALINLRKLIEEKQVSIVLD